MSSDFNIVYKPLNFKQIIGNSRVKTIVQNSISKGTYQSVSLFTGKPGIGKSTFAKVIASAMQCPHEVNGNPCLVCPICKEIHEKLFNKNETNVCNIHMYNMAKDNTKEHAEDLINTLRYKKSSKYKKSIFILEEPQNMSPEAQDTLLTTLEYLPDNTHVIFCTTDLYKMKKALVSRAQPVFKLYPPQTEEMIRHLSLLAQANGLPMEQDNLSLKMLCKIKENIPRDCISTLQLLIQTYGYISEQLLVETMDLVPHSMLVNFYKACDRDITFIYRYIDELKKNNVTYSSFIKELLIFTKDSFKLKSGVLLDHYTEPQIKAMRNLFSKYSYKEYIRLYDEISKVNIAVIDRNEDLAETELITLALRVSSNKILEIKQDSNEERKSQEAYTKRKDQELKAKVVETPIDNIMDIINLTKEIKNR